MNDQYVCIEDVQWSVGVGPKINDLVTFDGYATTVHIYLKEYPQLSIDDPLDRNAYHLRYFAKVISDTELYKELESINKTVEV